ncbi:MAG: PAB-dependent poly(A)-specific ribonuclease subunit 3 [Chaenotheca gracillima]|nr:MAG: PAB-dependent poly(A)-specific ribonuclease subunit 3 [Chaenotheca gracillima]
MIDIPSPSLYATLLLRWSSRKGRLTWLFKFQETWTNYKRTGAVGDGVGLKDITRGGAAWGLFPETKRARIKKRLNVDSPTFTPSSLSTNGRAPASKSTTISPKAVSAAPFTPKPSNTGKGASAKQPASPSVNWAVPDIQEFVPNAFEGLQQDEGTGSNPNINPYDPYSGNAASMSSNVPNGQTQINPYAQDPGEVSNMGAAYYQAQGSFAQPLQYHLYAPLGPHRENLAPYQRLAHDLFIPDNLREEMQRRAEAALQVLPNSTLPSHIDHFHSLVPLDTVNQKNAALFGHSSWIYKAMSNKDGKLYALRRLEGFRLTNEKSIRSVQAWKRIDNGNIVTIHDAFTTGAFGDRSLVFVTDYFPLSKTLFEHHFGAQARFPGRTTGGLIPEQVLWSYIVQIASALKTIHSSGLAARLIDPTKVLISSKNRIRLNACGILDVVQYDSTTASLAELQQDDLLQFGRLILLLGSNNVNALQNMAKAMEILARSYAAELKDCVFWLLSPSQSPAQNPKGIDQFLQGITGQVMNTFNNTLHLDDQLHTELNRELENARIVRLMAKFGFINERPEFDHDRQWSETGDRYFIKLFRDFVFHQVDAQGNPVIDLAHVLVCLSKLDAGIDERVTLVSRDEQNILVVSYRELKRGLESAFQDLVRSSQRSQ